MNAIPEQPQPLAHRLKQPVVLGALFEGALGVLAIALALGLDLQPWAELHFSLQALVLSLAGTLPLLALIPLLEAGRWSWNVELRNLIRHGLMKWLGNAGPVTLAVLALMAGLGEELLFRGVLQAGLESPLGTWGALLLASLLFGLAHALTPAYFILATLMGLYLGLIYLWTGNLLIAIAIHALYDWLALLYFRYRTTPP